MVRKLIKRSLRKKIKVKSFKKSAKKINKRSMKGGGTGQQVGQAGSSLPPLQPLPVRQQQQRPLTDAEINARIPLPRRAPPPPPSNAALVKKTLELQDLIQRGDKLFAK